MFNFFKKNKEQESLPVENSKWNHQGAKACVVYYINAGEDPQVDIELEDHTEESIEALCNLLFVLGTDGAYIETLNVMKEGFTQQGREDLFAKVAMQVALFAGNVEESEEGPCFKPSDVL